MISSNKSLALVGTTLSDVCTLNVTLVVIGFPFSSYLVVCPPTYANLPVDALNKISAP